MGSAIALSVGIGAAGSALALAARALTTHVVGPLPYDFPSTIHLVTVSLLGALAAVFVTRWASPSEGPRASTGDRFRHVPAAAAPVAAVAIWLGFTIQGARDEARAYDSAEHGASTLALLETRSAQRPAHAMTEFALGAAYLRAHRYPEAMAALGYAHELDPRNDRATELRKHALGAMIAESHPQSKESDPRWPKESDETTIRIGRYYTSLFAAGDHSPPVYEGILAGLRLEKRYDDAIAITELYLGEHPGDQIWTARLAELRELRLRDPGAVRATRRQPVAHEDLASMRRTVPNQPPDPWAEARFGYEYLKAGIIERTTGRDSLLAAATLHTRRAIALAPQNASYRLQLALVRFIAGDDAGCDSAFAAAARIDPRASERNPDVAALREVARARLEHRPPRALKSFTLRLQPPER
ncbi:MAG: hypothetical protein HOQ11_17525 [Gemmatimonadaceae bacterium]|nr:hypothetical protein [Gemmatimonadaceae bacterium]NUQ92876.1 hypothetical protein [Gemmatimonadaceae bacterium]NUR18904.1 hypothetical protein [Gemmatimonadaceae bacterium]NUS99206.1 hypothetical protein [Gemmatimonadaceae bacterium]